jgi:hypothetical protein
MDATPGPNDAWMRDLYQRDFAAASEDERQGAADLHDSRVKAAPRFSPLRDIVKGAAKLLGPLAGPVSPAQ